MRKTIWLATGISLLLGGSASAGDVKTSTMLGLYDLGKREVQVIVLDTLNSIQTGFIWANAELIGTRKEKPFYCPPDGPLPENEELFGILRRFIDERPEFKDYPLGSALLMALEQKYPCS